MVRSDQAALTDPLPTLRAHLQQILRAGVSSVDPFRLIKDACARGLVDRLSSDHVTVIAAGKAAWLMTAALGHPFRAVAGMVAGPRIGNLALPETFQWFDAAHPSPDALSERAGRRALALASETQERAALLVLLSGGASSMLAVPANGLSLHDKMVTARALMNAGAPIAELNCVRKHLSAIKGGRLAAAAAGRTVTLAISDVHGPVADDPAVIGSGPTVADPTTYADALEIVWRTGVRGVLPAAVMAHLERGDDESPKPGDARLRDSHYEVIGNRQLAMDGARRQAAALGYSVHVIVGATNGEARDAGRNFTSAGLALRDEKRTCVIASGETTVRVRGSGRGGRNQEFALGALPSIAEIAPAQTVVLGSAGTDGIDGPTDAAGAMVDTTTARRADRRGLDAETALDQNGAYDFFEPLGDLIIWGPTGTNVGDLHVLLIA
ncbi:MAG: glycerate kinase [Vicinamibacterales bacterium]